MCSGGGGGGSSPEDFAPGWYDYQPDGSGGVIKVVGTKASLTAPAPAPTSTSVVGGDRTPPPTVAPPQRAPAPSRASIQEAQRRAASDLQKAGGPDEPQGSTTTRPRTSSSGLAGGHGPNPGGRRTTGTGIRM